VRPDKILFGSGRPGTFGSGIDGSCGFGSDVAGADGSFGRLTGSFGNWTGPTFGSWIPDPEPLEPLLPPPDRIFAAVPAAAPSGSWTAEPAVPLTVLPGEAEPEDDFGAEAGAEPEPDPPADFVCVERDPEAEPEAPLDPAPGPADLIER
jgi:hypothetical protein